MEMPKLPEIIESPSSGDDLRFKETKSDAGDDKAFKNDAGDDKAFKNDAGDDKAFKNDAGDDKAFMESLEEKDSSANDAKDSEKTEKKGGSYDEVKENSDSATHEVHHMPADGAYKESELSYGDKPAIKMEKEDHKKTASYGNSKEAQEYRQKQKELIEQGKFEEAVQMDIDDIKEKFPDGRYDNAIAEMKEYIAKLKEEGRV